MAKCNHFECRSKFCPSCGDPVAPPDDPLEQLLQHVNNTLHLKAEMLAGSKQRHPLRLRKGLSKEQLEGEKWLIEEQKKRMADDRARLKRLVQKWTRWRDALENVINLQKVKS